MDRECPHCDCGMVAEKILKQEIQYGVAGPSQVNLYCEVPVWVCDSCGYGFTDWRGEILHAACVQDYLQKLLPPAVS
jgi:rubredoxin